MYCKNCGKQLPDGAQFCDGCGARQVDGGYSAQQVKNGYVAYSNGREPKPSVGFIDAIKMFFTKYADFNTRSRRSEYWQVILFCCIVSLFASLAIEKLCMDSGISGLSQSWFRRLLSVSAVCTTSARLALGIC